MLSLNKDWKINAVKFLELLDQHLQNDITPLGELSSPLEIESETCKEIHWDIFEHIVNAKAKKKMEVEEVDALWDEICEALPEPETLGKNPYLLKVSLSPDELHVVFKTSSI